jgi:methylase of polypeptide subunit release factors
MNTTVSDLPVTTLAIQTDPPLELFITETAFRPNPTTVRFSRTVKINDGDVVFDIGTGVGPLAICAAMNGAASVHGVDPVPMQCELARMNVAKYGLQNKVSILCGNLFEALESEPTSKGLKADVIIGDVSGIANPVARALGWYSEDVPTGGEDGTDVILDLINRARSYLAPEGVLYFPIAIDLSDSHKILKSANALYHHVENAMDRPTTQFPMSEQEVQAIQAAYNGAPPAYISIQAGRRPFWRGQIWKAWRPR